MNIRLSKHASEEIKRRKIQINHVKAVLEAPQQIVQEQNGILCYQSIISDDNEKYLIRVMINDLVEPKIVVTIYKTSKINKYWKS